MYDVLSKYYNQIFPHNEKYKDMLNGFIKIKGNALDMGCGTGRLTHDLYDLGMNVIGIDLDHGMIQFAKKSFPLIEFKVLNMLNLKELHQSFDFITCFGNTLPHLDPGALKVLAKDLFDILSSDGQVLIQLINYDRILEEHIEVLPQIEYEGLKFIRKYIIQDETISFETELIYQGKSLKGKETLYPYRAKDLIRNFIEAGFEVKTFGNSELKPFEREDYYLFIHLKKRCR